MILLTGGAGFIGSNVLRALNAMGRTDIILVDDLSDGRKCLNIATAKFADYIHVDELWERRAALRHVSTICHQGALSSTLETDGQRLMRYNFDFSTRLLELAKLNTAVFVYASSAAVYDQKLTKPAQEQEECERPASAYGASKLIFDNYVRRRFGTTPAIIGLRYFNVYGPGEEHKDKNASVAYHCFQAVKANTPPTLFAGSAEFKRDFVHVDDVVAVNLHCLFNPIKSGIYNVGTGSPRSFFDVANCVTRLTRGLPPVFVPFPEQLRRHYQPYTCANLSRLRATGYTAAFKDLETGLTDYWHKSFAFATL
jgi:ADP-L-glycero-D-manno-heptose 6-epimerase